jgi:hypothetical protein
VTLYFVRCRDKIKIGISNNLFDARLSKLRRENADEIEVLRVFHGPDMADVEKFLHEELSCVRAHHEWFFDGPEVRAAIETMDRRFNPENYSADLVDETL